MGEDMTGDRKDLDEGLSVAGSDAQSRDSSFRAEGRTKRKEGTGTRPPDNPPLSSLMLFRRSWAILREHGGRLYLIAMPSWACTALLSGLLLREWRQWNETRIDVVPAAAIDLLFVFAWWIVITVFFFGQGLIAQAVACVSAGKEIRHREAYLFALRRLAKLVPTTFTVAFFPLLVGMYCLPALFVLLLVLDMVLPFRLLDRPIPGWPLLLVLIYGAFKSCLFDKVLFFEGKDSLTALRESMRMLDGFRFRMNSLTALVVLVGSGALPLLLYQITRWIRISALAQLPGTAESLLSPWGDAITIFAALAGTLPGSVALVLLYFEIRGRNDGPNGDALGDDT